MYVYIKYILFLNLYIVSLDKKINRNTIIEIQNKIDPDKVMIDSPLSITFIQADIRVS